MKKVTHTFLCAIVFLCPAQVSAQFSDSTQVFTLEKMWAIAAKQNRALKLSALNLQAGGIGILEAKTSILPVLSLTGNYALNSKMMIYDSGLFSSPQEVPVSKYGYGFGYDLGFNIYNGGKDRRNIQIKAEEKVHKQYEFEWQEKDVKYAIAVAYYDLYKFQHFLHLIGAEITTARKQLTTIESLHKNGTVLKSDVLRSSVKLSQLELNYAEVEKKIELERHRLNILIGRESGAVLQIPDQEPLQSENLDNPSYLDYVAIALNKSPELKIIHSNVKISDLNVEQARSSLLPKVSLFSNYNYSYPQVSFYPYSNDLWAFGKTGVKLQFSIDNLYKTRHAIAYAQNLSEQEQEKVRIKKDEIGIKVKAAYLQCQQALQSVQTARKNIMQSTESVRVIRNSYMNQEALLTDLLDAENLLLDAKFNLTSAQANLNISRIRLWMITGTL